MRSTNASDSSRVSGRTMWRITSGSAFMRANGSRSLERQRRRTRRSVLIAAGAFTTLVLAQVLGDVPRPELDHVPTRVGDVGGAATPMPVLRVIVVQDLQARASQPVDGEARAWRTRSEEHTSELQS